MLTRSLEQGVPTAQAKPGPESFLTTVNKCEKDGLVATLPGYDPLAGPLYEREYPDLERAKAGHTETVEAVAAGRLKLQ